MGRISNIIIGSTLLAGTVLVASTYKLRKNYKKIHSVKEIKPVENNDRVYHELGVLYQDEEKQLKLKKAI